MGADPGPAAPVLSAPSAPGARLYAARSPSSRFSRRSPPKPRRSPPALGLASGLCCRFRVEGTISGGRWR